MFILSAFMSFPIEGSKMSQLFVESQSLDLCSNIHYTMYATFLCITVLCEITGVETFISSSPHIWSSLFLNHGASSKIRFSSFFFSFHKLFIFVMRRNVYGAYASSYMLFFFTYFSLCFVRIRNPTVYY
jgi:hypothetical protein